MDIKTLLREGPAMLAGKQTYRIIGGPGNAKSSAILEIARQRSIDTGEPFGFIDVRTDLVDPTDLGGFLFPFKEEGKPKARFTEPPIFPNAMNVRVFEGGEEVPKDQITEAPDQGLILFDEFEQAQMSMKLAACQLLEQRRIRDFALPDGWVIWTCGNRSADRAGVSRSPSIMENRVCTLEVQLTLDDFTAWAGRVKLNPLTVAFAAHRPDLVFRPEVPKDPGPFCTARSLTLLTYDLEALGARRAHAGGAGSASGGLPKHQMRVDTVAAEFAAGRIGGEAASQFMAHLRLGTELPTSKEIFKDPNGTPVPSRVDGQFIIASVLSADVTDKTCGAAIQYVERMGIEMQVLFVRSATKRDPFVISDKRFAVWVKEHKELLEAAHSF